MSDNSVIRYSSMMKSQFEALQANLQPLVPYGYYIIADGGFMAMPWIVANYPASKADKPGCSEFNAAVAATRHGVERAYGQLKMRFKILGGRSSFNSVDTVVHMNMAAIVLHNANLDTEAKHSALQRGPYPVSDGAPIGAVHLQQRDYAALLQFEVSGSGLSRMAWPEKLTRTAGQAVRRAVAIEFLGTPDNTYL